MINLEHLFWYVTHSVSNGLWNLFLNLYLDLLEFKINFKFPLLAYSLYHLTAHTIQLAQHYTF
jgi:hypothetical protein